MDSVNKLCMLLKTFDESKHKRDASGRFTTVVGTTVNIEDAPTVTLPPEQIRPLVTGDIMRAASDNPDNIKSLRKIGNQGVGLTYEVEYSDGSRAVFKPTYKTGLAKLGRRLRKTLDPTIVEAAREVAAYEISEEMQLGVVPETVFVNYGKHEIASAAAEGYRITDELKAYAMEQGEGHTQAWIEGVTVGRVDKQTIKEHVKAGHEDLFSIAILDEVIGNTDRHHGNYLYTPDDHYVAIDNGLAFPRDSKHDEMRSEPAHFVDGKRIPDAVWHKVQQADPDRIGAIMQRYGFTHEDITGMRERLDRIKRSRKFQDLKRPYQIETRIE